MDGIMDRLEIFWRVSGGEDIVGDAAMVLRPLFQRREAGELGAGDWYVNGV